MLVSNKYVRASYDREKMRKLTFRALAFGQRSHQIVVIHFLTDSAQQFH